MGRRTKAAILGAALIVGAGAYVVLSNDAPSSTKKENGPVVAAPVGPTDRLAALDRWREAASDPKVLGLALSTERDAGVRRALLERAARQPNALALFRGAWDATDDNAAKEQLLAEAARLGVPGAAGWLAAVAASDHKLATRAGAALGTIRDPRAAEELSQLVVAADGTVLVRANAARALGAAGGAEQVPTLWGLVANPSEPLRVRQEAALSLGRLRHPAALRGLADALDAARADTSTDGEQLRISLIQALESLGTSDARAALLRYASSNPSPTEAAFLQRALASSTARTR